MILIPRDWQAMAQREANELLGTHEGAAKLAEAKRYGLLADALVEQSREIGLLRGAIAADDERLHKAAERAGLPNFGCDTAEHLADEIERLREHAVVLAATAEEVERERCAAISRRWGDTHADGETVNARNAASKIARGIEGLNAEVRGGGATAG